MRHTFPPGWRRPRHGGPSKGCVRCGVARPVGGLPHFCLMDGKEPQLVYLTHVTKSVIVGA
jgi:hypothetical protein